MKTLDNLPTWAVRRAVTYPLVLRALKRMRSIRFTKYNDCIEVALDRKRSLGVRIAAINLVMCARRGKSQLVKDLLDDPSDIIVIETLKSIEMIGTKWALRELITSAVGSSDLRRSVCAWALSAFESSKAAEGVLLRLALHDPHSAVREHAIEALGNFKTKEVLEALLQYLEHGSHVERFWAIYSLGNCGSRAIVPRLSEYVLDQRFVSGYGTVGEEARRVIRKLEAG